ncbi:hypothetical protein D9M72_511370 [compost metagenome]
MSDFGVAAADFGHGPAAHLAGERAFVFPEDVLGSGGGTGRAQDAGRFGQCRKGGQYKEFDVAALDCGVRERDGGHVAAVVH